MYPGFCMNCSVHIVENHICYSAQQFDDASEHGFTFDDVI